MDATVGERMKRLRCRQKAGLAVLPVEIDANAATEFLISNHKLKPTDCEDRVVVGKALGRLIDEIVKEKI